jgi:hypothetical protein
MSNAFPGQWSPIAGSFQAIALTNSAPVLLAPPSGTNGKAKYALIQVIGANVNWRDDDVAPTSGATGGMTLVGGANPVGFVGNLAAAQFISTSPSGSTLLVAWYS